MKLKKSSDNRVNIKYGDSIFPELYKRTQTGAVQTWLVEIRADQIAYRVVSGQENGKRTRSKWKVCEGKNYGRSNETSAIQQTYIEIKAAYKFKLDKGGYSTSVDSIDERFSQFTPMLAQEAVLSKLEYPVYAQPKLDGIRCNFFSETGEFKTRRGEQILSCPHLLPLCELIVKKFSGRGHLVLDGELYNHDLKEDFNTILSLVRKRERLDEKSFSQSRKLIQYWVYDIYFFDYPEMTFSRRMSALEQHFSFSDGAALSLVPSKLIHDEDRLKKHYEDCLSEGFEGQIIRVDAPYEKKRTKNLLKHKESKEAEFKCVGYEEGKGNRSGMIGNMEFVHPNGKHFRANVKGTHAYLKKMWAKRESLIGKIYTVIYFSLTPKGIPRFGRVKAERSDY